MRIGIAQINTSAGSFDDTIEHMVAQSQRAAEREVELLVFPLAALAGLEPVAFADRLPFMIDVAEALPVLAERLAVPSVVPVPMDLGMRAYFDAFLIEGGSFRPLRRQPPPERTTSPAVRDRRELPQFSFADERIALAFSYEDLDELCDYDYDVDCVLFLSSYPLALDDPSSTMGANLDDARYVTDVGTMGSWLIGVAAVGGYGEQVLSGSSFVLRPNAELVALAPAFEEALLLAYVGNARLEPAQELVHAEPYDGAFSLWQAVSMGIHDFVTKSGHHDVALCLDGSVDASVLAALATDAVGPTHVHALVGASAGQLAPSCRELVRRLRIDHVDAVGQLRGMDVRDLDELQLCALAREHDALVLSPLDKTALALGAMRGQLSCAVLCPLGDIYRSDVLAMARVRNTISPLFRRVALTDADALSLPGEAGIVLRDETEQLRVDEILLSHVEFLHPLMDIVSVSEGDTELIDAALRAKRATEVWRRNAPQVLAMSTHTLDEASSPLGFVWQDRHLDADRSALDLLPQQADDAFQVQESAEQDEPGEIDIDATLGMLRDLAEQGGFAPDGMGGGPTGPGGRRHDGDGLDSDALGWMSPFSEN